MQTFEKQSKEKLHKKASCFQIPWLCAWIPTHFRQQAGADTEGGCRGCVPPTSPKEVLTWHVISLKIIAKIFLYCTLLNHYESKVHSYGRVSCSDELAVHTCPLLCLQKRVAKVAIGLFYCWSSLRNNSMATNLQRFTLFYVSRRFVAWDCWTHTSWQFMQRDSDMLIAVSHVHLYFVKRSMSEFIAMLPQVWKINYQSECDECAWLSSYTYAGFFSYSI